MLTYCKLSVVKGPEAEPRSRYQLSDDTLMDMSHIRMFFRLSTDLFFDLSEL